MMNADNVTAWAFAILWADYNTVGNDSYCRVCLFP